MVETPPPSRRFWSMDLMFSSSKGFIRHHHNQDVSRWRMMHPPAHVLQLYRWLKHLLQQDGSGQCTMHPPLCILQRKTNRKHNQCGQAVYVRKTVSILKKGMKQSEVYYRKYPQH